MTVATRTAPARLGPPTPKALLLLIADCVPALIHEPQRKYGGTSQHCSGSSLLDYFAFVGDTKTAADNAAGSAIQDRCSGGVVLNAPRWVLMVTPPDCIDLSVDTAAVVAKQRPELLAALRRARAAIGDGGVIYELDPHAKNGYRTVK